MVNQPRESEPRKSFEDLARELECDEDEAAFEETVRKVAAKEPPQAPKEDG